MPALSVCGDVVKANDKPIFSVCRPVNPFSDAVSVGKPVWLSLYLKLAEPEPATMVMLLVVSALPDVSRNWPPVEELLRLTVTALLVVAG